jgi:hypothetical protein
MYTEFTFSGIQAAPNIKVTSFLFAKNPGIALFNNASLYSELFNDQVKNFSSLNFARPYLHKEVFCPYATSGRRHIAGSGAAVFT